jgi:putative acetyltransferase
MRIEIRRAEPGDYKAVQQVHAQPRAIWGTLQVPFPSEEVWKKRLTEAGDEMYALVACVEGEVVAMAGLHVYPKSPRRRHVGYIGTALMDAIIELADHWLNLARLELNVWTDNEPALRLYKKFGFEIEGTQRKFAFRDGAYVDAYAMARVR